MFHQNIGTQVRSSTKYFVLAGLVLLLAGMGYSLYLYHKTDTSSENKPRDTAQARKACPLWSSSDVRTCWVKEPVVISAGELTRAGEFEFCAVVPEGSPFHMVQIRTNTLKMWSTGEAIPVQYKMLKRESLIGGKCPATFT